jgi:hypothetical protein
MSRPPPREWRYDLVTMLTDQKKLTWQQFCHHAEDLAQRLSSAGTAEAMRLGHEARGLAEEFRSWETRKPDEDVRNAVITRLFDLTRKSLEL